MSLRILSVAPPLVPLFFFSAFVVAQVNVMADCTVASFAWTSNTLGQSPCTVAAFMLSTCHQGSYTLPPPPYEAPVDVTECGCSTIGYSLISACSTCQGQDVYPWSEFVAECGPLVQPPLQFPNPVPAGIYVPYWAVLDVTIDGIWNASESYDASGNFEFGPGAIFGASGVYTGTSSPTGSSPTGSPIPTLPSSSKSSHTGVILAGVFGSLAVIAALIYWFYRRRRHRREGFDVPSHWQALLGSTYELASSAPMIEVHKRNATYKDVVNQFRKQWKHDKKEPRVIKLWRINSKQSVLDQFRSYQRGVERRTGLEHGNTRRRFHGTIRKCTLGDTSSDDNLCMQEGCNMCKIVGNSFQLAHAGEHMGFSRFGAGIYTTATSSKADDYYDGSMSPSSNRAMLLNDVVVGKAIKLTTNTQSLTQPPPGYDAVIGEPGEVLNYDECVVYNDAAIRPSFLIVYNGD